MQDLKKLMFFFPGLPEDKAFAKDLYTKSAALGNEEAKSRLEGLEAQEKVDFWRGLFLFLVEFFLYSFLLL